MNYRFKPTEQFWESFYDLSAAKKSPRGGHGKSSSKTPSIPVCVRTKSTACRRNTREQSKPWTLRETCAPFSTSKAIWSSPWTSARTTSTRVEAPCRQPGGFFNAKSPRRKGDEKQTANHAKYSNRKEVEFFVRVFGVVRGCFVF